MPSPDQTSSSPCACREPSRPGEHSEVYCRAETTWGELIATGTATTAVAWVCGTCGEAWDPRANFCTAAPGCRGGQVGAGVQVTRAAEGAGTPGAPAAPRQVPLAEARDIAAESLRVNEARRAAARDREAASSSDGTPGAPADEPAQRARTRAAADVIRKALAHRLGITSLRPLDKAADAEWLLDTGRRVVAALDTATRAALAASGGTATTPAALHEPSPSAEDDPDGSRGTAYFASLVARFGRCICPVDMTGQCDDGDGSCELCKRLDREWPCPTVEHRGYPGETPSGDTATASPDEVLTEAAARLRSAAQYQRDPFSAMLRGIAQRMDYQDLADYDEDDRARVLNCARAIAGSGDAATPPDPEDARLLAVAEARVASDSGRRYDLDEVLAEEGIALGSTYVHVADVESVAHTTTVVDGVVHLDWADGRLVGVEVLDAIAVAVDGERVWPTGRTAGAAVLPSEEGNRG